VKGHDGKVTKGERLTGESGGLILTVQKGGPEKPHFKRSKGGGESGLGPKGGDFT